MNTIKDYIKTLSTTTWENDYNQLEKIITVLATYKSFVGEYHIGINEINRYLYIMDHPTSVTSAFLPDLDENYTYAIKFLEDTGTKYIKARNINYTENYNDINQHILYILKSELADLYRLLEI